MGLLRLGKMRLSAVCPAVSAPSAILCGREILFRELIELYFQGAA